MSSITINDRVAGQVILASFFNDIKSALAGDFIGRDVNGVAVAGNNLGTLAYPWGTIYADELLIDGVALNASQLELPPYQIVSGKTRSGSNQPIFIKPAGSSPSFSILASSVNLILNIKGTVSSWLADVTGIPVVAAPSTQNTCLVNDATAIGQADSRNWGEYSSANTGNNIYSIAVDAAGTNITARIGSLQAFKHGTEVFVAFVSSAIQLDRAFRGFCFDSTDAPLKRTALTDNDTITLLNLGWVFADVDGSTVDTIFVGLGVNNSPTYSYTAPTSPATNDYWFDQGNTVWKQFDGASWNIVNRILVGVVVADDTNCIAARSFGFFGISRADNTIETSVTGNTTVKGLGLFQKVNVNGKIIDFSTSKAVWDTASNLAAASDRYNASVQANSTEYFYITDQGDTKISDMRYYWRPDLQGYYHPFNPWRAVAEVLTDGSAHFVAATLYNKSKSQTIDYTDKSVTGDKVIDNPVFNGTHITFGGASQGIYGNGFSYNFGGLVANTIAQAYSGNGGGYRFLGGLVNPSGPVFSGGGEGLSLVRNANGIFTVTVTIAGFDKVAAVATPVGISGEKACVAANATGGFEVRTFDSGSVSPNDHDFNLIVMVKIV